MNINTYFLCFNKEEATRLTIKNSSRFFSKETFFIKFQQKKSAKITKKNQNIHVAKWSHHYEF